MVLKSRDTETGIICRRGIDLLRCAPSGPLNAKIMLVGEAPGQSEEQQGKPFVGYSGGELKSASKEAGFSWEEFYLTNVFLDRPPNNKFHLEWCRSKKEVSTAYKDEWREKLAKARPDFDWPHTYTWDKVAQGKYVMPEHLAELPRLRDEILKVKPNLIVALGGTALWALLGVSGIKKLRGAVADSTLVPGQKVLPTWHPAFVQRSWENRLVLVADLIKARGEMEFPEIRRPPRYVWINPTIADLHEFYSKYIDGAKLLAFDTETAHKQITCISFAPSEEIALVIPFVDRTKPNYCYWETLDEEISAWNFVRKVLASDIPKLAQNGLYDLQYLWAAHHIPVKNFAEDTMLLHHALYLELPKDLGFLGSIYTNEAAWKVMRPRTKDLVEKKDD